VPVHCNRLASSAADALQAPRANLELVFCHRCGHVANRAFAAELLTYDSRYDAALHFSATFRDYAEECIDRLIAACSLHDKNILEIGCGRGEFLRQLCRKAGAHGAGFDPGYSGADEHVNIIAEAYSERYHHLPAELICCRHVLEHLPFPRDLLALLRGRPDMHAGTRLFFEVPNILYTLCCGGFWDLIFEHCSYFSASSLARIFLTSGFEPLSVRETYGGQFLCIDARPAMPGDEPQAADASFIVKLREATQPLAERFQQTMVHWAAQLQAYAAAGKHVAVWGAGSKGVSFLNVVPGADAVDMVIDLNPRKARCFVPGTGHAIVTPQAVRQRPVDVVLVMNPIYKEEIARTLCDLETEATIVCV
jgi:hypothetical protein